MEDYEDNLHIGFPPFDIEMAADYILEHVADARIQWGIDNDELFGDCCERCLINCIIDKELVHSLKVKDVFTKMS